MERLRDGRQGVSFRGDAGEVVGSDARDEVEVGVGGGAVVGRSMGSFGLGVNILWLCFKYLLFYKILLI